MYKRDWIQDLDNEEKAKLKKKNRKTISDSPHKKKRGHLED